MVALTILVIFLLIVVNGLLAMAELAVVSSRRSKLKAMADAGSKGAEVAMRLQSDPGRFLSTIQTGITLIGTLAGAVSGSTLAEPLAAALDGWGVPPSFSHPLAFGAIVAAIAYLSLVVGELVPKQLALRKAEAVAAFMAPSMTALAAAAAPMVSLLDFSSRFILKLIGGARVSDGAVTQEEIKSMVAEAESAGVLDSNERQMISGVMRLGQRPVRALMTPRMEVDIIDLSLGAQAVRDHILKSPYTRFLARERADGEIAGVILAKDVLNAYLSGADADPRRHVKTAPTVPETMSAGDVVDVLREAEVHLALVYDEYGHFEGVVTNTDILQAIIGESPDSEAEGEDRPVERDDGSWLLAGGMPADEAIDLLNIKLAGPRGFNTVAGLMLAELKRLPKVGESVDVAGWRLEVVDLDGRRIDKVLAHRLPAGHRVSASP